MNTNRNVRQHVPIKCLLSNKIDEEFQAVLFPINISQRIFLISNYRIKHNFITPITKSEYIKYVIGATVLIVIISYCRFLTYRSLLDSSLTPTLFFILWFDCFYYIVSIIVFYTTSAFQSCNNVLLTIKLQQALRTINFDKVAFMSEMKFWNWIHIICLCGFYWVFNLPELLIQFTFSGLLAMLPVVLIDLNIVYASRTINIVSNCLSMWNYKMVYYEKVYLRQIEGQVEDSLRGTAMQDAYLDIIKAYRLTEKVYIFGIINHAVQTFSDALITIQTIIEFSKLNSNLATAFYSPITWFIAISRASKNIAVLISICTACDKFYKTVAETDALCAKILQMEESDLRRTCKNVVRFNRAAFRKLSAFGVFAVDAGLPLRLLAAVLTYTVVLLQFALL